MALRYNKRSQGSTENTVDGYLGLFRDYVTALGQAERTGLLFKAAREMRLAPSL
jgi:hypothetical protein